MRTICFLVVFAAAMLAGGAGVARAADPAQDPLENTASPSEPRRATTRSPDDDLAVSEDSDGETAVTEDSDDLEQGSESPEDAAAVRPAEAAPKPLPQPPSCKAPVGDDGWATCLAEANAQITSARTRLESAEAAYSRSVNHRNDLGPERALVVAARDQARSDVATAEERLPELVERARRAGVGPRVLDPYQD